MAGELDILASDAELLLGDPSDLAERLPSPASLEAVGRAAAMLQGRTITNLPALREFLEHYRSSMLVPAEIPSVLEAWGHARANRLRELVALDAQLATDRRLQPFALASQAVGRAQLRRLQSLRDQRLVRRYYAAIQRGEACGWHTLVYGIVAALYSLPLRQALISFGHQTLRGFVDAAAPRLGLPEPECRALVENVAEGLGEPVSRLIDGGGFGGLTAV